MRASPVSCAARPAARYLGFHAARHAEHHTGHNPAGALAIVALLLLAAGVTASGWATFNEIGGHWLEEVHEAAANLMLAVVGVHLPGVLLGSWLHRENLVRAMITGRKAGRRAGRRAARLAQRRRRCCSWPCSGSGRCSGRRGPVPRPASTGAAAQRGHGDDDD